MLRNKLKYLIVASIFIYSSQLSADSIGSLLFHGNCITCHAEHKSISAPSISIVKNNYLKAFSKKEDFVAYMAEWVEHPNLEGSIMLDAIEKYELMPELGYDRSTLEIIATYIYETDFSKEHEGHQE